MEYQICTVNDWKNFILNILDYEYSSFEWQANEFAGRLLVPHSDPVVAIEQAAKIIKENNLTHYLKSGPDAVLSRISPMLCKPFGVSEDVIKRMVGREGLWPPELQKANRLKFFIYPQDDFCLKWSANINSSSNLFG